MEKKIVFKLIFEEHKQAPIKWEDIKHIDFQDGDIITAEYEQPYYSDNESHDGYYFVSVGRKLLETDEEFEERKELWKELSAKSKEERYKSYLKLKKEFEK